MTAPFIAVRHASYTYPGGRLALHDITLDLGPGEFVALVGRNGCGKSTFCRLLNGLLLPNPGVVTVDGIDTRSPGSELMVRSAVAMVFQVPDNQIVATVVEQDVAFGPENLGLPQEQLWRRVRDALELVGLWEQRERPPHLLSEGEKQRVAIAGALAMQPRCLVLDEATSMLDPAARKRVLEVAHLVNSQGTTVVWATHDMAEARQAQRIIALDHGRLAYDGSPAALFTDTALMARLGLLPPPAAQLAAALAVRRPSFPRGLLYPEQVVQAVLEAPVASPGPLAS